MTKMSVTNDESYESLDGNIMSNFDGSINYKSAEKLKTGKYYGEYPGWNFYGYVFWDKKRWACEVWVYHTFEETIYGHSLDEIMDMVSDKYGRE